jgi:hypothetical protein
MLLHFLCSIRVQRRLGFWYAVSAGVPVAVKELRFTATSPARSHMSPRMYRLNFDTSLPRRNYPLYVRNNDQRAVCLGMIDNILLF